MQCKKNQFSRLNTSTNRCCISSSSFPSSSASSLWKLEVTEQRVAEIVLTFRCRQLSWDPNGLSVLTPEPRTPFITPMDQQGPVSGGPLKHLPYITPNPSPLGERERLLFRIFFLSLSLSLFHPLSVSVHISLSLSLSHYIYIFILLACSVSGSLSLSNCFILKTKSCEQKQPSVGSRRAVG